MKFLTKVSLLAACTALTISAVAQQHVPAPVADTNGVVDNTPDSIAKARTARPVAGSSRKGNNPVLFLVGNSTMRTGTMGNGDNGQWGWGYFAGEYFDPAKITVENHALGGMSSRTFYNQLWNDVKKGIRPGDWVIIELGHNDNGPYDSGRARASIPGTGNDTLNVTIKETGRKETVYTYGEYLRRYIRETRQMGGKPIIYSLTPRKAWDDKEQRHITRNAKFTGWAREVAKQENVPFIDLNEITASKFDKFGPEKVDYMFYIDKIHTSAFGARVNAESAVEGIRKSGLPLADCLLPEPVDTVTGATRQPGKPMLFTIGDSTVKNKDRGDEMWGWGSVIAEQFDPEKIVVENHAMAGRSARTFLDEGRWDKVYRALKPGDFVIMQFGHNDLGDINTGKARGELWGYGPDSKVFKMEKTGINQVVYSFGWYLRKFIYDCLEKGATPIVVSHTPRNKWNNGKIESNAEGLGEWTRQVALQTGATFVDLNRLSGQMLQELGPDNTAPYFRNDHTHTSHLGAELNASNIAFALRNSDCQLKDYLKNPEAKTYALATEKPYLSVNGSGFDFNTAQNYNTGKPFIWSVRVPNGNYKVTVRLGNKKHSGSTVVRGESRRMVFDEPVETKKGKFVEKTFVINKRDSYINNAEKVSLNPREQGIARWDEKLSLEFNGDYPVCESITIEPLDDVTTVYLFGNSTVVDQNQEPWCSWGQIIPAFFDNSVVIANHAESGQSASSFMDDKRAKKALSTMKPGDYVFIEFGHNDQKQRGAGKGAYYSFMTNMKTLVDQVRQKGAYPVLVTPTSRRSFDKNGHIINTHGEYIDAVRFLAKHDSIPLIDLNPMTATLYESLGVENSKKAFVHYPAGTFPGQEKALADNTHFNPFGAYEIARCVVEGIRTEVPGLAKHVTDTRTFNPAQPDDPATFYWPLSPFVDVEKPLGN